MVAIRFDANGFDITQPLLFGRQVASHGFLRAAASAGPVVGYGAAASRAPFEVLMKSVAPQVETGWIPADRPDRFGDAGLCQRMDPSISEDARLRLWVGISAYSLCGVFHTTSGILSKIADLLLEPLTAWDAIVCPSTAILETVRRVHEAQADYLRWRLGPQVRIEGPQFPVIPLGVHCDDFAFSGEREAARAALGIAPDEIVALYVGRLSHTTKAHPFPIYAGLQRAAERTGARVAILECGFAMRGATADGFRALAGTVAPAVHRLCVDGRDSKQRRLAWAAGDLFLSLSDNIQETFGLTPVEAMAAGLPVVVSDWNGYRDTVEDGVQGFRVRSWAPAEGMGEGYARALSVGHLNPDGLAWAAAAATSVDLRGLTDRLCDLVSNRELRMEMGARGRATARERYAWSGVYRQYQELWTELGDRRKAAGDERSPRLGGQMDPFAAFGHYPTHHIDGKTLVTLTGDAATFDALADHVLFPGQPASRRIIEPLWPFLAAGMTVEDASRQIGVDLRTVALSLAALAKMGLATLR